MRSVSSQLGMFRPDASALSLARPYVATLLVKQGEREAILEHLTADTWGGVTLYLRVVPPELRSSSGDTPPARELDRIARASGDRGVYLDVAGTPRRRRRATPMPADYVRRHYESAIAVGSAFAPVYPFGRPDLAATIADFCHNELGAAALVSVDSAFMFGARRFVDELRAEVRSLGVVPSQLDVLLDLGFLRPGSDDPASILWLLRETLDAVPWRSAIIAATSVPNSMSEDIHASERDRHA